MKSKKNRKIKDYRSKKKLSYEERVLIEHHLKLWTTKRKIAKLLWRDEKTIYREIKRNSYKDKRTNKEIYKAKIAQNKTEERRIKANRKHIKLFTWEWWMFVEKIKKIMKEKDWSIQASVERYRLEKWKPKVSISTMYQYARKYDKELEKLMLYKSWWYRKRWYKYGINSKIRRLKLIEERNEIINKRERIWDYEIDLIEGRRWGSKCVLVNTLERKSRKIRLKKVIWKNKEEVKDAIKEMLKWEEVESFTVDNGLEFTDIIDICEEWWVEWYRCHPYSSYEKWSVEVHNRLVRRYIKKWEDIWRYSDEYIKEVENKINNLPRKILWYRTPEEVYSWKNIRYFN